MANIITSVRIICAAGLIFFPIFSKAFYIIYALGGLSDVLDGFVARRFSGETALGAKLDTIADMLFFGVMLVKVICAVDFPQWLVVWIFGIALIKGGSIAMGFRRSGKFPAIHSPMNRLCGIVLFFIPLCIGRFPWQSVAVLCMVACALATFAAVQEWHIICRGSKEK